MKKLSGKIKPIKKSKGKTKPMSPMLINGITFILGLIFLVIRFAIPNIPYDISSGLLSVGTAFFSTSIINFLWERRTRNAVLKMFTDSTIENWKSVNKIRSDQVVILDFKAENDKMIVTITHKFTYNGTGSRSYKDVLIIYSDYIGEPPCLETLDTAPPPFYFKKVIEDDKIIAEWKKGKPRENLCTILGGKLKYTRNLKMPAENENRRFEFEIHNEYRLTDRLVWTFQELSENATIRINLDSIKHDYIPFFRVNHPSSYEIVNDNGQNITLDTVTGEILEYNEEFQINKKILPNQGFEISWKPK